MSITDEQREQEIPDDSETVQLARIKIEQIRAETKRLIVEAEAELERIRAETKRIRAETKRLLAEAELERIRAEPERIRAETKRLLDEAELERIRAERHKDVEDLQFIGECNKIWCRLTSPFLKRMSASIVLVFRCHLRYPIFQGAWPESLLPPYSFYA